MTAKVWRKSVKYWQTPIFLTFSAWWASTISRYSAGESLPIKVGPPVAMAHLATACGGINIFWETWENISEVWEKSAAVDSSRPNSKEILLRLRQHFVHARILSTGVFCRHENFVIARILSSRVFCRRQHFVNASILSTQIFYVNANISVSANILSPPIFCRHQYFVAANIFVCVLCFVYIMIIINFLGFDR